MTLVGILSTNSPPVAPRAARRRARSLPAQDDGRDARPGAPAHGRRTGDGRRHAKSDLGDTAHRRTAGGDRGDDPVRRPRRRERAPDAHPRRRDGHLDSGVRPRDGHPVRVGARDGRAEPDLPAAGQRVGRPAGRGERPQPSPSDRRLPERYPATSRIHRSPKNSSCWSSTSPRWARNSTARNVSTRLGPASSISRNMTSTRPAS